MRTVSKLSPSVAESNESLYETIQLPADLAVAWLFQGIWTQLCHHPTPPFLHAVPRGAAPALVPFDDQLFKAIEAIFVHQSLVLTALAGGGGIQYPHSLEATLNQPVVNQGNKWNGTSQEGSKLRS